jgi:hypothetical protein
MARGGCKKIKFPAWLQFVKMFKHKMLENILSIPKTLFQPVKKINFLFKTLQKLKKVFKSKLILQWMHQV